MSKERIYLASPTMHGEELKYIHEAFDTNWIAPLGPNVNAFEEEMAAYTGTEHAAALSSGSAALHLAVKMLGIQAGDVVLCSSMTFAATCNPAAYEKANLVFIDAETETWNMSPQALRQALEKYPQAKAVIYVHLYGTPAKVDEILDICREYQVPVIEDAAESLGATYKGVQTGNFGDIAAYSFNGNKIITTSGGGMLVSHNKEYVDCARFLATQARENKRYYEHEVVGYNYRMSNVIAGIGRGQLLHLDEHIAQKKKIYDTYKEAFADLPIQMNPYEADQAQPNYWLSAMTIDETCPVTPDAIIDALAAENIESRPIWNPMHRQPVYADCDYITASGKSKKVCGGNTPELIADSVSDRVFARGLCLPSDIKMTYAQMQEIIEIIRGVFESKR